MLNINKKVQKQLRRLADQLPLVGIRSPQLQEITGEDLKLTGIPKNFHLKASDIKDDAIYKIKVPLEREVNHYKRMKELYKKKGGEAVIEYMEKIMKRAELESQKPDKE